MKPVSSSEMGRARKGAQRRRVAHQGPASSEPPHDASAEPAAPSLPAVGLEWRQALDAIADPICVVTSSYEMIYANTAYIALMGSAYIPRGRHLCFYVARMPVELHQATAGDAAPDPASPLELCSYCPLPEVVGSGRVAFSPQEEAALEATGTANPRLYERWIYPVLTADGSIEHVVEVLRDVTGRQQMSKRAVRAEAMREADQLKSELLGTVGHELRTPLAAIKGYAETLLRAEERLDAAERHEFLQAIDEASKQLEMLINRVLEISQLETGTVRPRLELLDLGPLISEAVAAIRLRLPDPRPEREPFKIVWHEQLHLPPIQGDPHLLGEALALVLENAVQYSPAGGIIQVAVRVEDARVVISVRDRGIGIPPEQLRAVFQRFHRVDTSLTRASGGMGLGLAICERIVELHGGEVWAESQLGVGSTFYLALPVVPVCPSREARSEERECEPRVKRIERILPYACQEEPDSGCR